MASVLKMEMIQSILHLHSLRWSQRRIARELDIDRGTVGRYPSRHLRPPNAAISPPGDALPDDLAGPAPEGPAFSPNRPSAAGRKSDCEPWRELIGNASRQPAAIHMSRISKRAELLRGLRLMAKPLSGGLSKISEDAQICCIYVLHG